MAETAGTLGDQEYFLRGWRTYRKVLDLNYMFHREVYGLLRRTAIEAAPAGFSFLDIACGDAAATAGALRGSPVGSYVGIDISRPALEIARDELAGLDCPVTLIESDFRAALAGWQEPVDIAWIGQSLHHFLAAGKIAVMRDVRRVLAPGGVLMIWEPTTLPGEDRSGWVARLEGSSRPLWSGIDAAEWTTMVEHCRASDYPETEETWLALGREAGFAAAREVYAAPTNLARVYRFEG